MTGMDWLMVIASGLALGWSLTLAIGFRRGYTDTMNETTQEPTVDTNTNLQALHLLNDLAGRFSMETRVMTAAFTDGGEGYSVTLRLTPGTVSPAYDSKVISFYNDDEFGPRYIGKAGHRVPGHKVIPYVTAVAENPKIHPSSLSYNVLGS